MEKLGELASFKEKQNIVLEGFDPVSAGGFTQVPNILLNEPSLTANAKLAYAKLLSYAWHENMVYPGQERMAREMGSSQPTVARSLRELESSGWLQIKRRGQGKTNLYVLKYRVNRRRG